MPKIVNVAQLSAEIPAFTQPSIRWLIFRASDNGLEAAGAIIRVGRRVLIDQEKFVDWVRSNGGRSGRD
jgi:hypothetical protein